VIKEIELKQKNEVPVLLLVSDKLYCPVVSFLTLFQCILVTEGLCKESLLDIFFPEIQKL